MAVAKKIVKTKTAADNAPKAAAKKPAAKKVVRAAPPPPAPRDEVADYIVAAGPARKAVLEELRTLIKRAAPLANESMVYRMPTYMNGDKFCAFANQKSYVSVYLCDAKVADAVRRQHPQVKGGKTCLNFPDGSEIPFATIERVVKMLFG